MVEIDRVSVIDTSESVGIYILFNKTYEYQNKLKLVTERLERYYNGVGVQFLDILVGVMEASGGPLSYMEIIFMSNDIDLEIVQKTDDIVKDGVGGYKEFIITSSLHDTEKRMERRYDFVG